MNRLLTILLLAVGTAYGQIDNPPTSVNIVDATATGRSLLTTASAAAGRGVLGGSSFGGSIFTGTSASARPTLIASILGFSATNNLGFDASLTNFWTATNAAAAATAIGLGATNNVTFSNVTVNGNISVGSLTTTTPSTWALDATQTAAATNGRLTLPSNANVIRLTNNNAISSVTNGVLGAFYYLVNQATNAVTISNVGGITIDGAQNLTLSPNESATLVATGATNVSVANRGDLTDVALGGTANTAPSQTASSGSSLMTRDLGDARYGERTVLYLTNFVSVTNSTTPVDTPLSASLPVGNYLVRSALFAENAVAAPGHAFQFGFTGSASPSRLLGQIGTLSGSGIRLDFPLAVTRSVSNSFITTVNAEGYVKVTSTGTLTVKYAQQTATTNVSQLKEGFLEVIKLP